MPRNIFLVVLITSRYGEKRSRRAFCKFRIKIQKKNYFPGPQKYLNPVGTLGTAQYHIKSSMRNLKQILTLYWTNVLTGKHHILFSFNWNCKESSFYKNTMDLPGCEEFSFLLHLNAFKCTCMCNKMLTSVSWRILFKYWILKLLLQ